MSEDVPIAKLSTVFQLVWVDREEDLASHIGNCVANMVILRWEQGSQVTSLLPTILTPLNQLCVLKLGWSLWNESWELHIC